MNTSFRKQRGVTLLQYVIGAVVGVGLTVSLLQATSGQRGEAELASNQQFIVGMVPIALQTIYYSANKNYTVALGTAPGLIKQALVERSGLMAAMHDGSDWDVTGVSTQSLTMRYGCEGLRTTTQCTQLASSINASGTQMIGTNGATAAIGGCPTAGANCAVQVVYQRPR